MTRTTQWLGTVSALALAAAPTLAIAAPIGTPANQDISNTASVTFTVAGNSSTVTSNPDVFKVDRKLDVVVTTQDSAPVAVALGGANAVTTFTVIADMAREVAGDAADVVSITRPGAEPPRRGF